MQPYTAGSLAQHDRIGCPRWLFTSTDVTAMSPRRESGLRRGFGRYQGTTIAYAAQASERITPAELMSRGIIRPPADVAGQAAEPR